MSSCRSRIPVAGGPQGAPRQPLRISVTLRKPKNWKVSIATSSTSASVAVPGITVRDEHGTILMDTAAPYAHERRILHKNFGGAPTATNIPIRIKVRSEKETEREEKRRQREPSTRTITIVRPSGRGKMRSKDDHYGVFRCTVCTAVEHNGSAERCGGDGVKEKTSRAQVGINGDPFVEVKAIFEEGTVSARDTSDTIRARGSGSGRRAKNDAGATGRRSKRRIVSPKDSGMGSNVSRHSGKGLSGRRTQSSGNLCNGAKILAPSVGRILNSCGARGVSNRDRNKFCGSLPNHLDEKELPSGECTPESLYGVNNNYDDSYVHPSRGKHVELVFHKLPGPQQDFSGGDQGYGSERSPEEELLPPLPASEPPSRNSSTLRRKKDFSFITKENTYEARLEKGSRGLGLSVTGGVDTMEKFPGLIRIKRIFPNQPAWECQILQAGDIILAANGVPLTGLTNYEALEVLRTTPSDVVLKVCRPPGDIFSVPPSSSGEPPPLPRRDPAHVISSSQINDCNMLPLPQLIPEPYEFEIVLKKVNGSLGFMLRKEDGSVLGHCVRALVREPALSDGRIRPGDKIVTVNGVDISPMSHEEAVTYLRQCGEEVRLRLYRDPAQTPVSALSPTESYKTFRPKPTLRKEAMDMLCDLAVKKLSPSDSSSSSGRSKLRGSSPGSSPRRRKLKKTPIDPEEVEEKPQRPNFLDLCMDGTLGRSRTEDDADSVLTGTSGSEVTQTTIGSATRVCNSSDECNSEDGMFPGEPASMPPVTSSSSAFSYKNPAYQSAHPTVHSESESTVERLSDPDIPNKVFGQGVGSQGLLKWKGVVFTPEDGVDVGAQKQYHHVYSKDEEVLTVELCRGWNSRLGFSLQSNGSSTCISAIYADSVAAKDGRLQLGDEVVMINDESTEDMSTSEVIDLLRKIRGSIAITVKRKRKETL